MTALRLLTITATVVCCASPLLGAPQQAAAKRAPAGTSAGQHPTHLPPQARAILGTANFRQGSAVVKLVCSPDGNWLAAAGSDGSVRLWDAHTGQHVRRLGVLPGAGAELAFSADGRHLLTQDRAGLHVWETTTGNLTWTFALPMAQTNLPRALNLDGKMAALVLGAGQVQLIRGKMVEDNVQLLTTDNGVNFGALQFSRDGKRVRAATLDFTIVEWSTATGHLIRTQGKPNRVQGPAAVAFSWPSQRLAVAGSEPGVGVYDMAAGRKLHQLRVEQSGLVALALSADGRLLAAVGTDDRAATSTIFLWDATAGRQLHRLDLGLPRVQTLCLAPDGQTLYTGHQDAQIRVWDIKTGKQKLQPTPGHNGKVTALAYSPDSRYLVSGSADKTVRQWEVKTGKLRLTLPVGAAVDTVAYAPDGKVFASAGADKVIRLWDAATGKEIGQFKGHDKKVTEIAFAPDGKYLVSRSRDQTLRLWNRTTGKQVYAVKDENESPPLQLNPNGTPQKLFARGLAFSKNGQRLATGGVGTVWVRDTATGEEKSVYLSTGIAEAIAFAPDGRTLAVADGSNSALLFETGTNVPRGVLAGQLVPCQPLGFVGSGNFGSGNFGSGNFGSSFGSGNFGSGSFGGPCFSGYPPGVGFGFGSGFGNPGGFGFNSNFGSFNPQGGFQSYFPPLGMMPNNPAGHAAPIRALAFAPRGKYIVTGGQDAQVLLWNALTTKVHTPVGEHNGPVACVAFAPDGKTLATAGSDTAIILWDVHGLLTQAAKAKVDPVQQWWDDLGNVDAPTGFQAMQQLADHPERSLPFLKEHLQPVKLSSAHIQKLLGDLGSPRYAIREKAAQELEKVAEVIEPAVREAMAKKADSLEVYLRLSSLADKVPHEPPSLERLRQMRALELLERMDVPTSRQILETLARGAPEAWLTREAQQALERLQE